MHAKMLILSPMDILKIRRMAEIAKTLNPKILILLCADNLEEAKLMQDENIGKVYYAKHEMAQNMAHHILVNMGFDERQGISH